LCVCVCTSKEINGLDMQQQQQQQPSSLSQRLGLWVYTVCASGLLVSIIVFVLVTTRCTNVYFK